MCPERIATKARTIAFCRLLGVVILAAAFELPSARIPADARWSNSSGPAGNPAILTQPRTSAQLPLSLRGVHCAWMSLLADLVVFKSSAQERRTLPFWMFLAALSGWSNPLIVLYLPFGFSDRFFKFRFTVTMAILLCLAATFVLFATSPFVPLIGYFLWLLGIFLVILPLAELL